MPYLITFTPKFKETIVIFEVSTFAFGKWQCFIQLEKNVKHALFGFFRPTFEETIVTFEITSFECVEMQSLMLKGKN